ncbi:hypothetical protein N7509_003285 [Penicillium cosmopolitanum]|uniref:Cut9 interacting protein Scn1 n=1 Tax=Penicillium cosmopolitanum TaxID=1131564 RepID=A0A9W9W4N6_9EURO|nr:uncharacterized protein N7509_003285 [Penicillium cosmopolitanum]KAJ5403414.1 hypothetical protein N7509_003285 [Penicillium cosmopolitanum]
MSLSQTQPQPQPQDVFPWELGIYDAHCHPTDTMASVAQIPSMKATTLTIMATRAQDQELVAETAQSLNITGESTRSPRVLPSFGWHPWFSHQIINDTTTPTATTSTPQSKENHYINVLTPSPASDLDFISQLPSPKLLSALLNETRERLRQFPSSLVGEVGLDKAFRLPGVWTAEEISSRDEDLTPGSREGRKLSPYKVKMDHQRAVLKAQLQLAGEMQRPVSVHSVQAHGVVFDLFKELWNGHEKVFLSRRQKEKLKDAEGALSDDENDDEDEQRGPSKTSEMKQPLPFPPRICMHSYSGPVEPIRQFLHPSNPSDVYFSFSAVINFSGAPAKKISDVIKALPDDRILIESDLHIAGTPMDDLLEDVARQICQLRGWDLRAGVKQLADNWNRFVYG